MASLNPPSNNERLSQLLPSVKCSNCGQPVPLQALGEHICAPAPPMPSRPSPSQAILAKIRQEAQTTTQPLIPRSQPSPPRSSPSPSIQQPGPPQRLPSPAQPGTRSQTPLSARSRTPQPTPPPQIQAHSPPVGLIPGQSISSSPQNGIPPMRSRTPQAHPPPPPASQPPMAVRSDPFRAATPQLRGNSPHPPRMLIPNAGPPPLDPMSRNSPPVTRPMGLPQNAAQPISAGPPPGPPRMPPNQNIVNGEVNMAGVGRRGFQAAAHAALLAASMKSNITTLRNPAAGMDGRRNNAPRHLDINAHVNNQQAALSPNTPRTPYSAYSPRSPAPPSPNMIPQPAIASPRTPSPPFKTVVPLQPPMPPKTPDTIRAKTPDTVRSNSPAKTPLSARLGKDLSIDTTARRERTNVGPRPIDPPSPTSDSDYSSGLAYDRESDSVLSPPSPPTSVPTSRSEPTIPERKNSMDKVHFPTKGSPPHPPVGLPSRSISSASSYSYASRTTSKSTSALDRTLETLFENPRSPPIPALAALPMSPPMKSPKLPTRSRTTPAMSSTKDTGESNATRARPRQCTRCSKTIEDGRWVKAENAGVLCERCWKTMYLPKCRRCNRPIEKQAVSSADGQLKGKYHRECFNCHKCQQPFPDKEFYVFDGKPYCRYHYHEANDSLCASCGQPIEGPCAVAHTGERYHPEHLLCEYEYPALPGGRNTKVRCREKLEEYWEVDGRMLCERHAGGRLGSGDYYFDVDGHDDHVADDANGNEFAEGRRSGRGNKGINSSETTPTPPMMMTSDAEARTLRRKTQFIDLR